MAPTAKRSATRSATKTAARSRRTPSRATRAAPRAGGTDGHEIVALVLQGGGALGAYQAGVMEGLEEANLRPDWVAGISIGALNSAVIAGNPPGRRAQALRAFWQDICRPTTPLPLALPLHDALQSFVARTSGDARRWFSALDACRTVLEGQHGFFTPRWPPPLFQAPLGDEPDPASASFYDTSWLRGTLERHADFDRINDGEMRVSVGAVDVRTGNFEYFDTRGPSATRLTPEHFMASGALPPGFPAVKVGESYYWDGGLVSNTPLAHVLQTEPRRNTLAFQVDLWSARGELPQNLLEVQSRQKDIQYSSRTRAITDALRKEQRIRRMLREILEHVPERVRRTDPWCQQAEAMACGRKCSVIHLIYRDRAYEGHFKDYEFSPSTMNDHWSCGLRDVRASLEHPEWLQPAADGSEFVTHDIHRGTAG